MILIEIAVEISQRRGMLLFFGWYWKKYSFSITWGWSSVFNQNYQWKSQLYFLYGKRWSYVFFFWKKLPFSGWHLSNSCFWNWIGNIIRKCQVKEQGQLCSISLCRWQLASCLEPNENVISFHLWNFTIFYFHRFIFETNEDLDLFLSNVKFKFSWFHVCAYFLWLPQEVVIWWKRIIF